MHRALNRLLAGTAASCGVLALAVASGSTRAEDIDIYMSKPAAGELPNVLFVIDNSANWSANLPVPKCFYRDGGVVTSNGPPDKEQSKKIGLEKCALYNVIDAIQPGANDEPRVNIGLMIFNESPASNSGGYPRVAFTPMNAAGKAKLKKVISEVYLDSDSGNNAAFAKSLHEAYLYYAGAEPRVGDKGKKFDPTAFSNGRYASPSLSSCGRNYVIFLANGRPGEVNDTETKGLLASLNGDTTPIEYPAGLVSNSDQGNWADEYTRFMSDTDVSSKEGAQSITTYAVAVTGASSDGNFPNFIEGMAHYGGGAFYKANSVDGLEKFLLEIFQQVAAVDSAFVSASLPVSVNSRGTYLNQVFMGLFRPDDKGAPRWRGNLKQYQFAYNAVTQSLQLADRNGNPAISSGETGFFSPTAESFWSASSTFWKNEMMGTPPSASDLPDGEVVEKGGAAYRLRLVYAKDLAGRNVYTCVGCLSGTSLGSSLATQFKTDNPELTTARLGLAATTTEDDRKKLIEWVRGVDNANGTDAPREFGPADGTVIRPSVHGDVLHGRPVVVNYGPARGVVVFYGANDGMLRAVNGNQSGTTAGDELWSFVPEEGLPRLNRLRTNRPLIRFTNTPPEMDAAPRDYFFDGPLSFYQKLNIDGTSDKVYLFAGMRRGGRALYAFDVTDPAAPRFMWKLSNAQIPVLGQTWSEARVAKIKGHSNPVIVMGAGYDPDAEDVEPQGTVTMGNAVLVLDAVDGTLLRKFDTTRSVAADVSLVDSDYDGFIDRGYAADLGGKVYRIDFEVNGQDDEDDWTMTLFADLASSGGNKIMYPPDVVLTRDFAVVLVGTGDREKPLDNSTSEHFFTLLDRNTGKGVPVGSPAIGFSDLVSQQSFTQSDTARGCYIPMNAAGEKIVNAPLTAGGITYFSTNRPNLEPTNSCTDLGLARVYGVPLVCGAPKWQALKGGGLPPSPVAGNVAIRIGGTDADPVYRRVPFIIGGFNAKNSGIEGSRVELQVPPRRKRLYWYPETDR